MLTTWKFRLKCSGSPARALARHARAVNTVWNFAKETQIVALRRRSARMIHTDGDAVIAVPNCLSSSELDKLTAGSSKLLGLHSQTVQAVTQEYVARRKQFSKLLRWRGRKSLGWIPWKASGVKLRFTAIRLWTTASGKERSKARGFVTYMGHEYEFWCSRLLPDDARIKVGSFTANALGEWFLQITFASESLGTAARAGRAAVVEEIGIDIGVKTLAASSTGEKIDGPRLRERFLERIRKIERTRRFARRRQAKEKRFGRLPKSRRVARLHEKVTNARNDHLHKKTTDVVRRHAAIYVGDVSLALMNRSRSLSGVSLDQAAGKFKQMLRYKAERAGGVFQEVNERDSTRTCSNEECLFVGARIGLGVREWTCGRCGARHDRDTNAARNILRAGRGSLTRSSTRIRRGA